MATADKHIWRTLELGKNLAVLEVSWGRLGWSWRRLGGIWKPLAGILGGLGGVLEGLGGVLKAKMSQDVILGALGGCLGRIVEVLVGCLEGTSQRSGGS